MPILYASFDQKFLDKTLNEWNILYIQVYRSLSDYTFFDAINCSYSVLKFRSIFSKKKPVNFFNHTLSKFLYETLHMCKKSSTASTSYEGRNFGPSIRTCLLWNIIMHYRYNLYFIESVLLIKVMFQICIVEPIITVNRQVTNTC